MSTVMEFLLSTVRTFGALCEIVFQSVYPRTGKATPTPQAAKYCVTKFRESFPGISPFTKHSIFEEREVGTHDLCSKVARKMNRGSSLNNWK